jgi:hypothetical protein
LFLSVRQAAVQFIDRLGPEGIARFGAIEGQPNNTQAFVPVIADIRELFEAGHVGPVRGKRLSGKS